MVFCLCGRRFFSRTLVINSNVNKKSDEPTGRPTYYQISTVQRDAQQVKPSEENDRRIPILKIEEKAEVSEHVVKPTASKKQAPGIPQPPSDNKINKTDSSSEEISGNDNQKARKSLSVINKITESLTQDDKSEENEYEVQFSPSSKIQNATDNSVLIKETESSETKSPVSVRELESSYTNKPVSIRDIDSSATVKYDSADNTEKSLSVKTINPSSIQKQVSFEHAKSIITEEIESIVTEEIGSVKDTKPSLIEDTVSVDNSVLIKVTGSSKTNSPVSVRVLESSYTNKPVSIRDIESSATEKHVSADNTEKSLSVKNINPSSIQKQVSIESAKSVVTEDIESIVTEEIGSVKDTKSSLIEDSVLVGDMESSAREDEKDLPRESRDKPKLSIDMELEIQERRPGVEPIATRIDENIDKLPKYIKDPKDEKLIKRAIQNNDFLNQIISKGQLKDVVAAMYNKEISSKEIIIRQGDKGSHMYVSAEGTFQIIVNGKVVSEFKDVRVFGELAILYNAQRQATIKTVTAGRVWVLESSVYQRIMIGHNLRKHDELMNFLVNNEILNVVGNEALQIVANLMKSEFFKSGETIVRQGDRGDKFYIIRAGTVTITKEGEGVVGVYKKGDCFGELALLEEDSRQASVIANAPGAECLTLTRQEFIDHLGEIKKFKYIKVKDAPKESIRSTVAEHEDINIRDLKIIKTLGVGGFGRVELVQHTKEEKLVFALKYLKKIEVVQQNQQEHVYNEKVIQMACRSPFIVRLYRTYKDTKYIYFLMESCLGGDLWSLLQKQKIRRFEEKQARFICACVLEAFDYLHSRNIIYRDLKPENLLIASNGIIKLTDFGFAKKISGRGKTYTFAGTPEYVAPEIVLNRGHDRAVDYWAFGVFVFEMLSGKTPFRTDDSSHMRTYNKILSGIDNIHFPTYINLKARHLIEKLCRPVPSDRLGMQRNEIQDIKSHKWFLGIDWQKLNKVQISSSFVPKLNGPIDTKYFDQFKRDTDHPPDELSGWDEMF